MSATPVPASHAVLRCADLSSGSDAGSDASSVGEPEPEIDDDFMASLMPTSRLDKSDDEGSDDSSDDEGPLTAEQIRALRANGGGDAAEEAAPKRDFAEELKGTGRVPMMFGTSAAGSVRIDWARIEKEDMQLFVETYAAGADTEGQTIRESSRVLAWLLKHSLEGCVDLMMKVAKEAGSAALVTELQDVQKIVAGTALAEEHLCSRKLERTAYQHTFDHMTDAIQDVCTELKGRLEERLGPHEAESVTSVERVTDLLDGLKKWLEAGGDPEEIMMWTGLQLRLTWAPTLQMRDKCLFVESMELKKRRKKHISADAFHRDGKSMLHHVNQRTPASHDTRGWLLQHALEQQLGSLSEVLSVHAQGSDAVTKSVGELRRAVDGETAKRLVSAEGGGDYVADLVDAVHDFVTEFTARAGRLAEHAPLAAVDTDRVQYLVEEVRSWLDDGVDAAKSAQSSAKSPWRSDHGASATHPNRLAQRWNAVFATGARVWRMLDMFDADDAETLQSMVLCGMPLDMILDEGGESLLMAAAQRNATACVEWLLDEGAEMNAANNDGSTAFHYACAFGSLHSIASLLKHDCDVDIKDDEGKTGADLADSEPWRDILNMMMALGFNKHWKELEVLIDDQTRVRSLEDLVEAEADKRRPNLEYQSLPPSRWMEHHVIRWLEDAFAWSGDYLTKLKSMSLTGESLVTSDDEVLRSEYEITSKAHRQELMEALKDQDLWGWE